MSIWAAVVLRYSPGGAATVVSALFEPGVNSGVRTLFVHSLRSSWRSTLGFDRGFVGPATDFAWELSRDPCDSVVTKVRRQSYSSNRLEMSGRRRSGRRWPAELPVERGSDAVSPLSRQLGPFATKRNPESARPIDLSGFRGPELGAGTDDTVPRLPDACLRSIDKRWIDRGGARIEPSDRR